jgi:hypothetical protein
MQPCEIRDPGFVSLDPGYETLKLIGVLLGTFYTLFEKDGTG